MQEAEHKAISCQNGIQIQVSWLVFYQNYYQMDMKVMKIMKVGFRLNCASKNSMCLLRSTLFVTSQPCLLQLIIHPILHFKMA